MNATPDTDSEPLRVPLSDQLGLVAKLRDPAQATNWGVADNLMNEAADKLERQHDEIERLRAELAEMTADRDSWAQQASQRTQDALDLVAAERERCAKVAEGAQHLPNDGQDFANGWCSAALQIAQAIRGA